ncbi:MAG: hypothetical protein QGG53_44535, partial [Planctomycetota bacterium]|nr:hypothetical protein [Planctomycetota bacterium]
LLSVPGLDMIQWTPGASNKPSWHRCWWPIYHKTVDAGKKLFIQCNSEENLRALKTEFAHKLKQFLIGMSADSPEQAEQLLRIAEV